MSDTAVLPERETQRSRKTARQPLYHVILINDDDHTYEYVIEMMIELFKHPVEKGFQIAREVDEQGRSIVLTTTFEHAELKQDQIHSYGPDKRLERSEGSMTAVLEPAE